MRRALLWLQAGSLVLTCGRQILDFLGYLWLPALLNLAHILASILGLAGAVQLRPLLLAAYLLWLLVWGAWNGLLVAFHLSLGALDGRDGAWLGFGLRGSRSFWITHSPLCTYTYDYAAARWLPDPDNCSLAYYWLEAAIATVHALLAVLLAALTTAFLVRFAKEWKAGAKGQPVSAPRVTVEFGPTPASKAFSALPNGLGSAAESKGNPGYVSDSSGYLNTSFEPTTPSPNDREQGGLLHTSTAHDTRRSSKKKKRQQRSVGSRQALDGTTESELHYAQFAGAAAVDDFSLAPTAEAVDSARLRAGRAHSSTRETREAKAARRQARSARSVSPGSRRRPPLHHGSEGALQSALHGLPSSSHQHQPMPTYSNHPPLAVGDARPYRHYNGTSSGASHPDLVFAGRASEIHNLLAYPREPCRLSTSEQSSSGGPPALPAPGFNAARRGVISFDPKSEATLLRCQPHHLSGSSQEMDESADSPPLEMAPTLGPRQAYHQQYQQQYRKRVPPAQQRQPPPPPPPPDRISYDSGIPSSSIAGPSSSEGSSTSSSQPPTDFRFRPPPTTLASSNYYEPPSSHQPRSPAMPPPPTLTPIRDGVLVALDSRDVNASFDSNFSLPPPPPPDEAGPLHQRQPSFPKTVPTPAYLPPSRAAPPPLASSANYERRAQPPPPPPPRHSPTLHHHSSLLV